MSEFIRFHLDENVDSAIVLGLRRYEIDVALSHSANVRRHIGNVSSHIANARHNNAIAEAHNRIGLSRNDNVSNRDRIAAGDNSIATLLG